MFRDELREGDQEAGLECELALDRSAVAGVKCQREECRAIVATLTSCLRHPAQTTRSS